MEPCISTSRDGAGSLSRPCGVYPQSLTARHRPRGRPTPSIAQAAGRGSRDYYRDYNTIDLSRLSTIRMVL